MLRRARKVGLVIFRSACVLAALWIGWMGVTSFFLYRQRGLSFYQMEFSGLRPDVERIVKGRSINLQFARGVMSISRGWHLTECGDGYTYVKWGGPQSSHVVVNGYDAPLGTTTLWFND